MIKVIKLLATCTRQLTAKANGNEWCTMFFSQFPPNVSIVYQLVASCELTNCMQPKDIQYTNCEPKLTT